MSRAVFPFCALLVGSVLGGPSMASEAAGAPAEAPKVEPLSVEVSEQVKLVRTLQFLQDGIVSGEAPADDARRNLIDLVGANFLAAPPETWNDRRNADAALLYVLNGGDPAVLARLPKDEADAARTQLIAAIAAFGNGSMEEARKLWEGVDIQTLPLGLVGPAALVKANLLIETDPAQALRFADIARLEAPGTLVEEAAIRRGIEIAAKVGDASRFAFYTASYAIRFPRSMYGTAFRKRFSDSYLAVASKSEDGKALKLDEILAPLSAADRREIFLEIAHSAVLEARMPLAQTSAENAVALSERGSPDRLRAEFYRAAALAISSDPGNARSQLEALPAERLEPGDRDLLAAVLALVDEIQKWPVSVYAPSGPGTDNGVDEIAAQAKSVIAAAAATLVEVGR